MSLDTFVNVPMSSLPTVAATVVECHLRGTGKRSQAACYGRLPGVYAPL
jgi:hypothetical protein